MQHGGRAHVASLPPQRGKRMFAVGDGRRLLRSRVVVESYCVCLRMNALIVRTAPGPGGDCRCPSWGSDRNDSGGGGDACVGVDGLIGTITTTLAMHSGLRLQARQYVAVLPHITSASAIAHNDHIALAHGRRNRHRRHHHLRY